MDRYSSCRKSKNRYVTRITPKFGNVVLNPLKSCNLVHIGVAAFCFFRMFFAQCGKCKMTEAAKSVIDRCQDDALFGKCISSRTRTGTTTTSKTASVYPNHNGQF